MSNLKQLEEVELTTRRALINIERERNELESQRKDAFRAQLNAELEEKFGASVRAAEQAKVFADEALTFGAGGVDGIRATELQAAFRHWAVANHIADAATASDFGFAITAMLKASGGRKVRRKTGVHYVGVAFSPEFQQILTSGGGSIVSLETRRRLGRGLVELMGEKPQPQKLINKAQADR